VVMLIGERPGGDAASSRSLSAYIAYRICDTASAPSSATPNSPARYEYSVISNIYDEGTPPARAAEAIAGRIRQIMTHKAAGNRLEARLQKAKEDSEPDERATPPIYGPGDHAAGGAMSDD
jgi:ethanolamine ammonia-lyase large subunit